MRTPTIEINPKFMADSLILIAMHRIQSVARSDPYYTRPSDFSLKGLLQLRIVLTKMTMKPIRQE